MLTSFSFFVANKCWYERWRAHYIIFNRQNRTISSWQECRTKSPRKYYSDSNVVTELFSRKNENALAMINDTVCRCLYQSLFNVLDICERFGWRWSLECDISQLCANEPNPFCQNIDSENCHCPSPIVLYLLEFMLAFKYSEFDQR